MGYRTDTQATQTDIALHTIRLHTVTDAHPAVQSRERVSIEDVSDHPIRLALVEASLGPASDDTTGILASVLE